MKRVRARRARPATSRIACLGLLWCFTTASPAADLLQIYTLAQRNDPTFQAARAAYVAAAQKLPQALAGLLPNVNMSGNDGLTQASTTFGDQPSVDRKIQTWNWALQLDQPVIHMDKVYAYRESKFAVKEAEVKLEKARIDLILRVSKAYFDVLVAQEGVTASEAQVSAMQQQLARAQHGFRAGIAAVTDVYESKSRLELARSKMLKAVNDLDDKRAELQKITNEWPKALDPLNVEAVIPQPSPDDSQAWIRNARKNNLAVQSRQAALSAAAAEINRVYAGYLPTVDLTASYGKNYSSGNLTTPADYSTRYKSWQVGVRVVVPIYSGGETSSKVTEAIAKRDEAASQLQAAERQAATDARRAYSGIKNGIARINALESSLKSAKGSVKGNEVGYRLGIRINTDVLNAQEQLYATLHDLAKARYDTLLQSLKLKAAVGILSLNDLTALNSLLKKS